MDLWLPIPNPSHAPLRALGEILDNLIRTNNLITNNDLNERPQQIKEMCLEHYEREIEEELNQPQGRNMNNSENQTIFESNFMLG